LLISCVCPGAEGRIAITGDAVGAGDFTLIAGYSAEGAIGSGGISTMASGANGRQSRGIAFDGEKIVWMGMSGSNLVIERYLVDGSPDTAFNGTGSLSVHFGGGNTQGYALKLQSDGRIVVAGRLTGTSPVTFISRFNPNGTPDNTFGTGGVAFPSMLGFKNPYTYGLAVQRNGKLLLASTAANRTGFALLRLHSNGSLDSTFGQGGVSNDVEFSGVPLGSDSVRSVALADDGGIYVSGSSNGSFSGVDSCDFAVAKYRGDPTQSDIQTWRFTHFGSAEDTGSGADGFDFDKDGVPNIAEFAFGLNPKSGQSLQTPQWSLVSNNVSVSFDTPSGVSGVTYGAEWNNSLTGNWNTINDTGTPPQHVFTIPRGSSNSLFVRLKITRQ